MTAELRKEIEDRIAALQPEQEKLWAAYQAVESGGACPHCGKPNNRREVDGLRDKWSKVYNEIKSLETLLSPVTVEAAL